jgi:hypothetical protein
LFLRKILFKRRLVKGMPPADVTAVLFAPHTWGRESGKTPSLVSTAIYPGAAANQNAI